MALFAQDELDICRWLLGDEYEDAQCVRVRQSARSNKGYDNPQVMLMPLADFLLPGDNLLTILGVLAEGLLTEAPFFMLQDFHHIVVVCRVDRSKMKRIIDSGELGAPLLIKACHRNVAQGPGFKTEN